MEMKVTYLQVAELLDADPSLSINALRARLGSGSLTTISAHRKAWVSQKAPTTKRPTSEILEPLEIALRSVKAAFDKQLSELGESLGLMTAERDALQAENGQFQSSVSGLLAEKESLVAKLAASEGQLGILRSEVEDMKKNGDAARNALAVRAILEAQLAEVRTRNAALESENVRLRPFEVEAAQFRARTIQGDLPTRQ